MQEAKIDLKKVGNENKKMEYNICIVGHPNTGKTSFLGRMLNGDFSINKRLGLPTIITLRYDTTIGKVIFNCQESCDNDNKESFDAFILFMDRHDFANNNNWITFLDKLGKPYVKVCSKYDEYQDNPYQFDWLNISSKTYYRLDIPLLRLLKKLTNDNNVMYVWEEIN